MSIFDTIKNAIMTTEADVQSWIIDIAKGADVTVKDLESALNWLAGHAPAISEAVQSVEAMVEEIIAATPGAKQNATVTAAIAQANAAVAALNAFANSANAGNTAEAVVSGYVAYQQATAAVANAKASAAGAISPPNAANSNTVTGAAAA